MPLPSFSFSLWVLSPAGEVGESVVCINDCEDDGDGDGDGEEHRFRTDLVFFWDLFGTDLVLDHLDAAFF